MSGHSGFAPIGGNIPAVNPPQIGGAGDGAQPPANVPNSQPQGQPLAEQPNPSNARSLAQKLDAMLLKAAKMSVKSVDASSLKAATKTLGLNKADQQALTAAAAKAQRMMKAVSGFTGRQIASAFVANENGVFNYKKNAAARAIRGAIDAHGELSELLHGLANMLILSKRGFASTSIGSCIMAKWAFLSVCSYGRAQNRIRKSGQDWHDSGFH